MSSAGYWTCFCFTCDKFIVRTCVDTAPRSFYSPTRLDYLFAAKLLIGLTLKLSDSLANYPFIFCLMLYFKLWPIFYVISNLLIKFSPDKPRVESLALEILELSRWTLECLDTIRVVFMMSISFNFYVDSIIELPFNLGDYRFLLVWCISLLFSSSSILKLALDMILLTFLSLFALFLLISFETFL